MAANRLSLVTLALGLVLVAQLTSGAPQCSRVNAAFNFDNQMQIIIGDELLSVGDDNNIHNAVSVSRLGFNHDITAAVSLDYGDEFFLYSDKYEEGFTDMDQPSERLYTSYSDLDTVFAGEPDFKGIDAAVEIGDELYYFAGCSYVTVNEDDPTDVSDLKANSDLGLPCNVDAALYSPLFGRQVVIKGDQVWMLHGDTFLGPSAMEDTFWGLTAEYKFCKA